MWRRAKRMTLEHILHKLTELYDEAEKLDKDCATAISHAEDTVINTLSSLRAIEKEKEEDGQA